MKRVCPHCGAPMYRNVCEYCQMPVENNVPVPAKRRKHVWLWCILAAVILGVGAVIAAAQMGYMEDASPKIVENDAVALAKMQESGVFSAGTYLVGEEIPAGEYVVVSDPEETDHLFYAGIYADREKEQELSEGWHEYSAIVQLEEGTYFSFSWANCYDITKNNVPNDPTKHSGMFCVGRDIEPGTYHICPIEKGNQDQYPLYGVYTSLGSVAPVIVESGCLYDTSTDTVVDSVPITLKEGQYLKLYQCIVTE